MNNNINIKFLKASFFFKNLANLNYFDRFCYKARITITSKIKNVGTSKTY